MKKEEKDLSRRDFIKAAAASPVVLASSHAVAAQEDANTLEKESPKDTALPRRKLGKTGAEVTILTLAGHMEILGSPFYDKAWAQGIRYFDTADCYKGGRSELDIGKWLSVNSHLRKDLFLVTKDHPHGGPQELLTMIDKRLAALQTDYVDMFFIHGIGAGEYGEAAYGWPKSKELKGIAENLKKSGKIKFFGFSCHDKHKSRFLNAAAEGGFIDGVMAAYSPLINPWMNPTSEGEKIPNDIEGRDEFQKALDKCYEAGVGLVSMKELRNINRLPKNIEGFEDMGYSTHQLVLHAVWTDERIASVCSGVENEKELMENAAAARNFPNRKPFTQEQIATLRAVAEKYIPATGEQLACAEVIENPYHRTMKA